MSESEPRTESRMEAAIAGRTIFLRERPCRTCGSHEFYTNSGQCVPCTKRRAKAQNDALRSVYRAAKGLD